MCREAVASQDPSFARGWNGSVLLLLALVPVCLGVLAFATWRASRRTPGAVAIEGRPRWPTP
ncbi:MAG: hypothetical protein NTY35_09365 [Planctomycetota bacterium]|nr:hypothetical protein [Planctomycetota bacterium]